MADRDEPERSLQRVPPDYRWALEKGMCAGCWMSGLHYCPCDSPVKRCNEWLLTIIDEDLEFRAKVEAMFAFREHWRRYGKEEDIWYHLALSFFEIFRYSLGEIVPDELGETGKHTLLQFLREVFPESTAKPNWVVRRLVEIYVWFVERPPPTLTGDPPEMGLD